MTRDQSIAIGVGAVIFRGDEVLIIKRGKAPFLGQWSIPGGGLEFGEKVTDAVIREVREETGLEVKLIGLLDVFDAIPEAGPDFGPASRSGAGLEADQNQPEDDFATHTVIIDYVGEWVSGEPVAGDDAAAAEFVSIEEAISRLSWDVTRQALARALEIRADFYAAS